MTPQYSCIAMCQAQAQQLKLGYTKKPKILERIFSHKSKNIDCFRTDVGFSY